MKALPSPHPPVCIPDEAPHRAMRDAASLSETCGGCRKGSRVARKLQASAPSPAAAPWARNSQFGPSGPRLYEFATSAPEVPPTLGSRATRPDGPNRAQGARSPTNFETSTCIPPEDVIRSSSVGSRSGASWNSPTRYASTRRRLADSGTGGDARMGASISVFARSAVNRPARPQNQREDDLTRTE
jgi:hypothetical protein